MKKPVLIAQPALLRKALLAGLITLIVLIGVLPRIALAQTTAPTSQPSAASSTAATSTTGTWYNQSFQEFYNKVYNTNFSAPNEIFGERYTAAQVQWVIYSLFSFILTGGNSAQAELVACATSGDLSQCLTPELLNKVVPSDIQKILTGESNQNKSFLATITSNPISGVGYVSGLVQKFHIVPVAYAQQGFGYSNTTFIQDLWKISRNIAYALLVIAVIIMSFMIMFRVKISPQVVITVQSALPKIVLALILITFSYAIAGFLIDLTYVVIGLLATILTTPWAGSGALSGWNWSHMFQQLTQADIFWVLILYWISFIISALFNVFTAGFAYGVIFLILAILSIFVLLWYSIKILVLMFKTFFNIMISIITAPFSILAGTVMQGAGFGPWLRGLVSNLMVYPLVGAMLFLANLFLRMADQGFNLSIWNNFYYFNPQVAASWMGNWWDPPLSNGIAVGGGGSMRGILLMGVSWTIISMIPKTAELVKSIMAGKEFENGSAIGEARTIVRTAGGGAVDILKSGNVREDSVAEKILRRLKWLSFIP
ncbi:MAG: hypothetical protein ABSA43_01280 [Candidatus Microgenomates bacterium]|jgi:hypothetical protein